MKSILDEQSKKLWKSISEARLRTLQISPDLQERWRKLYPKRRERWKRMRRIRGRENPGENSGCEPLDHRHVCALAFDNQEKTARLEIARKIQKTLLFSSLCLFAAIACEAFGLGVFCLFLASLEALEICELVDASA